MTPAFQTIARGDSSSIASSRRVVARDAAEWRAVWAAHAGPSVPEPVVDFETTMVAAAFAGERPTAGFEITISAGRREGTTLLLVVEENGPPAEAVTAQMITSPFHIITLPRYDGEVRFVDGAVAQNTSVSPAPSTDRNSVASAERTGRSYGPLAPGRRRHEPSPSSTGLTPQVAGALAYLAGPFSGALLLTTERTSRFVKFHAWQALLGLGALLAAALVFLALAFALLIVSATAFWTMLWIAAITAAAWVAIWAVCLVQAYNGRLWKMPVLGGYAERRAGIK